ncbi:MAG TPA: methyltransferase domain-containing protein [Actinophytocola sp.]|uniref:class I SAM-dependent methyltransferase n=1 Tax=Actinophytocola sp. TaxID=1872138 RepID=UPI002DB822F8|nr:methyltransferase domain-containing protein [Actinophytocola sp.]HEU5472665.1 methyltransferase domain-containing protein [Actinophytocola sp.]
MDQTLRLGEYLLAIEGLAMIRHCLTEPAAVRPRVEEIRRILDELPGSVEIPLTEYDVPEGYSRWARRYDGPNPAIAREQPIVHAMLAELPAGRALDAACGTGRHAAKLVELGHQVVGVDATPAMLALARQKVPGVDFRRGQLERLPVQDASVDLITCALALTHVPDLGPVLREFARVLRPGGTVVISDVHPMATMTGAIAAFPGPDLAGGVPYVRSLVHQVGAYLTAIRAVGLSVRDCLEPPVDESVLAATPGYGVFPEASRQAFLGMPYLLIWRLGG